MPAEESSENEHVLPVSFCSGAVEFHKFSQACPLKAPTITGSPQNTPSRLNIFHTCTYVQTS